MQLKQTIALDKLDLLNPLVSDYLKGKEDLRQLYTYEPQLDKIGQVIKDKNNFPFREELHDALKAQYKGLSLSAKTAEHLDALQNPSTFTVCTAHQLCLFTGPSYFIYKILSAIKLAQQLKEQYPDQTFIPVYWMGSEDHDFEEISQTHVYGKTLTWHNEDQGPVGRNSLEGFEDVVQDFGEILGKQETAVQFIEQIKKHFTNIPDYGSGFQSWILELFKDYGLLVIDQDDTRLKTCFQAVMKDELLHESVKTALHKNEEFLEEHYHTQATARPINLFYLKDNLRERIEREGNTWKVLETNISFNQEELEKELNEHPERFSPNVFLRPLYQETILPNVAFIGGPGEVSYWLQLKDVFDHYKLPQPLILLRDMAVMISKNHLSKLDNWHITVEDMFAHYHEIAKDFVKRASDNELNLNEERDAIAEIFAQIKAKAIEIDPNMDRSVDAEQQKVFNSLANLESKLIRAEKRNYEQQLSQLENIQSKLLPNNTLQERYDNFTPFYLKYHESYFETLLSGFNPFEQKLKIYQV